MVVQAGQGWSPESCRSKSKCACKEAAVRLSTSALSSESKILLRTVCGHFQGNGTGSPCRKHVGRQDVKCIAPKKPSSEPKNGRVMAKKPTAITYAERHISRYGSALEKPFFTSKVSIISKTGMAYTWKDPMTCTTTCTSALLSSPLERPLDHWLVSMCFMLSCKLQCNNY